MSNRRALALVACSSCTLTCSPTPAACSLASSVCTLLSRASGGLSTPPCAVAARNPFPSLMFDRQSYSLAHIFSLQHI